MGYSISWLAIRGQGELAAALGLKRTGKKANYGEAMYTGRRLAGGWFLMVMNECEHPFVAPESLSKLSVGAELLACSVEEHVMVSTSELWKDGAKVWRIEHNAQESIDHIKESGVLPEGYSDIKNALSKKQEDAGGTEADTDYFFDIPLATAKRIVGFKHDEDSGVEDSSFEIFEGPGASAKPWWKFWK